MFKRYFRPRAEAGTPPKAVGQRRMWDDHLNVEQATARSRLTNFVALIGIFVTATIKYTVRIKQGQPELHLLLDLLFACYGCLMIFSSLWLIEKNKSSRLKEFEIISIVIRLSLGTLWALTFIVILIHANSIQRSLVYALAIGIMSTTVLGGTIYYALSIWFPITAGSFIALALDKAHYNPAILLCLCGYSLLTLVSTIQLNRKLVERTKNAAEILHQKETIEILLKDFEEEVSDWIWETDQNFHIVAPTKRFAEVARRKMEDMNGSLFAFLTEQEGDAAGLATPDLKRLMLRRQPFRDCLVSVTLGQEARYWSVSGKAILTQSGAFNGYRGVGTDVTEIHRTREQINHLARHDGLTNLYNRGQFDEALEQSYRRPAQGSFALLYIDLDRFKAVNDKYGHAMGDLLLVAAAQRIHACIRKGDSAARLGGDEFAVLLNAPAIVEAEAVASRIVEALAHPFSCDGVVVTIGASIGLAYAPENGVTPDELRKNADLALYQAKSEGRGTWRCFDRAMANAREIATSLETGLRQALDRQQFFLCYQPVVSLETMRVVAVEALLRWRHPEHGVVMPAEFIKIAEQSDLMRKIGIWVIEEACREIAVLPEDIYVSVNLSPIQLRDVLLEDKILQAIADAGVSAERLEFELTETTILDLDRRNIDTLSDLRRQGIRFALDDFGTGFSSLSLLRHSLFDRIKIDKSFIDQLDSDPTTLILIDGVISLAQSLGMRVTVEGVETLEQVKRLQSYTRIEVQGHYFASARSALETTSFIREWHQHQELPAAV
jgi:diguanylate cyclase (GGDEF)-like protein